MTSMIVLDKASLHGIEFVKVTFPFLVVISDAQVEGCPRMMRLVEVK